MPFSNGIHHCHFQFHFPMSFANAIGKSHCEMPLEDAIGIPLGNPLENGIGTWHWKTALLNPIVKCRWKMQLANTISKYHSKSH